jgi:hypothetical protein
MTNRNLRFNGFAYGDTPVTLDVKINGQQVFLNTVSTIPGAVPTDTTDITFDQTLFEINDTDLFPTSFEGAYTHSIEVSGGSGVLLGIVLSNYMANTVGNFTYPGNVTSYPPAYHGTPTNSVGTPDPRSSVQINGVDQVPPLPVSTGIWTWQVDNGSNLSCLLNIGLGNVAA